MSPTTGNVPNLSAINCTKFYLGCICIVASVIIHSTHMEFYRALGIQYHTFDCQYSIGHERTSDTAKFCFTEMILWIFR